MTAAHPPPAPPPGPPPPPPPPEEADSFPPPPPSPPPPGVEDTSQLTAPPPPPPSTEQASQTVTPPPPPPSEPLPPPSPTLRQGDVHANQKQSSSSITEGAVSSATATLSSNVASSSSSTAQPPATATSTDSLPDDPAALSRLMARQSLAFFQEIEIDRVLSSFKLNPYDILEATLDHTPKDLTKLYRKKSLLIHPDKVSKELNARAIEAFDLLKKAESVLLDEEKRKTLDETVLSARFLVLKEQLNLPTSLAMDSPQLVNLNPPFEDRVRKATRELMIDDELRRRKLIKMQHAMEGAEERKREEALVERKRKVEEKERWEETREERVAGWRAFDKKKGKKRKADAGVLG